MINRQLYTMKFKSSRLKKYNYDITIDYKIALDNGEIVALSDNQLLRTIRDVVVKKSSDKEEIKERILNRDLLEEFYKELKKIRNKKNTEDNRNKIAEIKGKIIKMSYVPEYITIVMEHDKHYDYLYKYGLKINGMIFRRLSTSAGQGRVSTVVFCSENVLETINEILDNGRDKTKKFSPSKFNAYKGTYGSATKTVTTPRFCVVPDYESTDTFTVNFVTETEGEHDDKIELREVTRTYNRWDGQGLISYEMSEKWANDLGLDYVPSQFCIRQSFVKGMLNVFPFHEFCETENNKNYMVKSVYKDANGNEIYVDLREVDVILTESQFKLWDSYNSLEEYKSNCEKNNLKWGVSLYTDKEIKNVLKMNYQFLQALDIKDEDIPQLCNKFEKWIRSINTEDIWGTLLFLVGTHITEESLLKYFKDNRNYWIKALIVNHDLINDKYIKQKIYNMTNTKIDNACMGSVILDGNNQTLVSDPYAMMEYLCGIKPIKGLLNKGEYYSHHWNERNIKEIAGMRPPLTYRSEVVKMKLVNTEKQRYWYRYNYGGIIVNIHGHETDNWAGSDWDYDFLSTTSEPVVLKSIYENEYPIVYDAPKPNKIVFTDEDLFIADKFTFGSIIGAITNKSTTGHALLKYLEETYGKESREYQTVLKRIKMCTKLQSAQIDKAKIGRNVKGIPLIWTDRKYIKDLKLPKEEQDFLERIMLDRHPYFFIHLYPETRRKYKKYIEGVNLSCTHKFGVSIDELIKKIGKNDAENEYIKNYYHYMPVVDSGSVMNNICKYVESVDFDLKNKIKTTESKDIHLILMRNENIVDEEVYNTILENYKSFKKELKLLKSIEKNAKKNKHDETEEQSVSTIYEKFKNKMDGVCSNVSELVDYLIHIFYVEYPSDNKDLLWNTYGDIILNNLIDKKQSPILFPLPDYGGDIEYLNKKFKLKEVTI